MKIIWIVAALLFFCTLLSGCQKPDFYDVYVVTTAPEQAHSTESSVSKERVSLVGRWWDTDSKRCFMQIEQSSEDVYSVTVHWSNSVSENTEWKMQIRYDPLLSAYTYANGVKQFNVQDENGSEIVDILYKNGSGIMQIEGEKLFWTDDIEGIRNGCAFEKE